MATALSCLASPAAWQQAAIETLTRDRVFGDTDADELACLIAAAVERHYQPGESLVEQNRDYGAFFVLLEGSVRVSRKDAQGQYYFYKVVDQPCMMNEVALLSGTPSNMAVVADTPVMGLHVDQQGFWDLMAKCTALRKAILEETMLRTRGLQVQQTQQEKLAMLGTMTAGLMHELNNPGAAARRAASQLRANLQRMHELARGFSERGHTPQQRACLSSLQDRALSVRTDLCMSSLQQSDLEEDLGSWMDAHGLQKAWEFAPVLVSSGIRQGDLECLAGVFSQPELGEPVEWLEATASSMQMVSLVEESVARVTELAQAVKSYAHEGQGGIQDVDVNESIHATLVMLRHKFREKNIHMQKDFGPGIPKLHCVCSGLNQVWTNLLDNAIDAVPANGGSIGVRTLLADGEVQIAISDNGSGISAEDQEHIFDPFFTTKAAGVGTGLGLGIVRKILESYHGRLTVDSHPGHTEFVVYIPAETAS